MTIYKILFLSILVIFTAFTVTYSLLTPTFEGPDEALFYHHARYPDNDIPFPHYALRQPLYYSMINFFLKFIEHPEPASFDHKINFEFSHGFDKNGDPNRWIHTTNEKFPYDGSPYATHILRVFSIILGIITLILVYKIAELIVPNVKSFPLFVMGIVAFVPKFTFINSILNSDVILWPLATVSLYFLLKFVNDKTKIKFLILVGIFSGLALLAKQNAMVLIPVILTTFVYLLYSKQIRKKQFLKFLFIISIFYLAAGGAYFTYIVAGPDADIKFQTITGDQFDLSSEHIAQGFQCISNPSFLFVRFFAMLLGFVGYHVFAPTIWTILVALVIVTISIIGLFLRSTKKFSYSEIKLDKNHSVILLASVIFMVLGILYFMFNICAGDIRYAFPVISCFGVLFSIGFYFLIRRQKLKILLLLPLFFLIIVNIGILSEMNKQYAHGFQPNLADLEPVYDFQFYLTKNSMPIAGDWDGDGKDTIGLYQPNTATFYLKNSHDEHEADIEFNFAPASGVVPITGDWDGDGKDTIGLYQPNTATFYLKNSYDGHEADIEFNFGPSGGIVSITEDWDGNYIADEKTAFFPPNCPSCKLHLVPITGDWNGYGIDTMGLYQFFYGQFYLKNSHEGGEADILLSFGTRWDILSISGDWNGDGRDTIGLYQINIGTFSLRNSN